MQMYEEQHHSLRINTRKKNSKRQLQQDYSNQKRKSSTSIVSQIEEEKLEAVDLSGLSLESLPSPSLHLASICKLDLSNNNLQSIPESLIARLLNVEVLDVRSNQLKTLPNSIGCLSKLKVLNLSGNLIQSIPKTIENCRSLEELNANFNQLKQLPETLGFELVNLKKLSVNSNKITFLPYSTSHLTNLRVLDARLNHLQSLPNDLENLINLQTLNISQNFQHFTTLPYSIGLLMSLVELDISYNNITQLPESIGCLKRIQKLNVDGNPLVSPSMDIVELGLHVVKQYLCDKMNGVHMISPKNNKSWLGKFARCTTFSGRTMPRDEMEDYYGGSTPNRRSVDGVSTVGLMGLLSPRRLFSPKSPFSK